MASKNPTPAGAPTSATPRPVSGDADSPEVARLRKENADLRDRLAAAGVRVDPPAPAAPSFGMSEGTREELERTGKATDPFTGEKLTTGDLPA